MKMQKDYCKIILTFVDKNTIILIYLKAKGVLFKMAYKIDPEKCISCGACEGACPVTCIKQGESCFVIDKEKCIECGTCEGVCPVGAPKAE